jgi:anaerobic ribonucleoside-triphosphate reductase activating protein
MLLHGMVSHSTVNGPGERCVIWFQGCTLGCSGCWNPDTHKFDLSKRKHWSYVLDDILHLPVDLEGITFSGGDPMQHFWDLKCLIDCIKVHRPHWSIGMFTGYTYKELIEGRWKYFFDNGSAGEEELVQPLNVGSLEAWKEVEENLDFAIMGRYNKLLPTDKPLVTTSNQELKIFTDRYKPEDFESQAVEITIDENGIVMTGFPVGADLVELKA